MAGQGPRPDRGARLSAPAGAARRPRRSITYDLPRLLTAPHDVGDSHGNIWFNGHRTTWISKLDPRTGTVKDHKVPSTAGANPRAALDHRRQERRGLVLRELVAQARPLRSEIRRDEARAASAFRPAAQRAGRRQPRAVADGFIWEARAGSVNKIDPATGQTVFKYMLKNVKSAYGNELSADGNYWRPGRRTGQSSLISARAKFSSCRPARLSIAPKRGGFDPDGNAWFGGAGGALVKIDAKTRISCRNTAADAGRVVLRMPPPTRTARSGPASSMPGVSCATTRRPTAGPSMSWSRSSHDRRTWIDNTTTPVSIWYVDHDSSDAPAADGMMRVT